MCVHWICSKFLSTPLPNTNRVERQNTHAAPKYHQPTDDRQQLQRDIVDAVPSRALLQGRVRMPRPSRRTCSAQVVVRGNRWSRVTNLGAYTMRSIFVACLFSCSICAVVEAADAQPSALAVAAGTARVPMLFTGAVAADPPPPPQCDPGDVARS